MDAGTLIDLYCERTTAGFWNEIVNALSNSTFLLAAGWGWLQGGKKPERNAFETLLIFLAGSIGVGSFLFHTFATQWAKLADVIPIWSFVLVYTTLMVYRISGQHRVRTACIMFFVLAFTWLTNKFTEQFLSGLTVNDPALFNGSLQYAPAMAALIVFSTITYVQQHPIRHHLLLASILFSLSLFFRTVDLDACSMTLGIGTHFIWHMLSALMIAVLLHAMILRSDRHA